MKKTRILVTLSAVLFSFITVSANAALLGRLPATPGGTDYQAAYDTVLDITWVTNAALSTITNWDGQVDWASGLNYPGFTDWRLAQISVSAPVGSQPDTTITTSVVDCSSDTITEMQCRDNELGYMFYYNIGGTYESDQTGNQTVDGVELTGIKSLYWSGTEYNSSDAWIFSFGLGRQYRNGKGFDRYGWAVYDGDISDADSDGVLDDTDNCTDLANAAQIDTDADGHGNICDGDFDNDCAVAFLDLSIFKGGFFGTDPELDLDSDGVVAFLDLSIFKGMFFAPPGPSACGACPCP